MSVSLRTLPHRETLRGYDLWSARYDLEETPLVAATSRVLDRRPPDFRGARVLELGCGTGRHAARALAGGAAAYCGVDGSPGMIGEARRRVRDPRCRWRTADLAAPLDLGSGEFDLALVVLVIEQLADLAPPFAAAARALRPSGILRIVEIHPDLVGSGTVAHFQHEGGEVRFTSYAHPVAEVLDAVTRAGFVVGDVVEHRAEGDLLAAVPRLAKHRGARVVLDVAAHRP